MTRPAARALAATLAVIAVTALAACDPADDGTSDRPSGGRTTAPATAPATVAGLPDLHGMGLQAAQDRAQSLGFHRLDSHDSLGRGREQIWDRDWKVCFQSPAPGRRPTATTVDLGTVKLAEACPANDAAAPPTAGATMPDLTGASLKVARQALPSATSITAEDATDQDRFILLESNWRVCSQSPAPGAALHGQPVSFKAVKFGEHCP
ncbi:hypothetical protein ACFYXS_14870 [Streptomyces sp. NPDC002574]|uniref:hypothetical protein n=1 Tax=Streptomyces sp. NPDC002574 TaxID=3364652 RepID=UPI0036863B78